MFARETLAVWTRAIMSHEEGDQRKRERKDKQSPLGAMYESENAIDGTEAAKNDRRMTAWLWNDT